MRTLALALSAALCLQGVARAGERVHRVAILDEPRTGSVVAAIGPDATTYTHAVVLPLYSSLYGIAPPPWGLMPAVAASAPTPIVLEVRGERIFFTSVVPLRRDVHWSDGTQLTAEDVAFSYNAILAIGPDALGGNWPVMVDPAVVDHVEALDEHTVKFWLKKIPGLFEWEYGVLGAVILQKARWEPVVTEALASQDPAGTLASFRDERPVASGGWVAGSNQPGTFWELVRDLSSIAEYERIVFYEHGGMAIQNVASSFSYRSGEPRGAVQFAVAGGTEADRAVFRLYPDRDTAEKALAAGEVDEVRGPASGLRYLAFNLSRKPMDDRAFRQAVATLIDKEFVARELPEGAAEPLHTVVPREDAYWHHPGVNVWGEGMSREERLREAVRILKEAGYTWEKEPVVDPAAGVVEPGVGLRMPGGDPVPGLELLAPGPGYDPLRTAFATWIERWVKSLGVPVHLRFSDFNGVVDRMYSREFDMVIMGWSLGTYPDHLYLFFHSSQTGRGWNFTGYSNPEYDRTVEALRAAKELDEARRLSFRAQEILAEDVPYVVLFGARASQGESGFPGTRGAVERPFGLPARVKAIE